MTRPCVEPLVKITGEEIDSSGRSRTSTIRRDGRIHDLDRAQLEMGPVDGLELQPRALNYRPLGREIEGKAQRLGSHTGSTAEAHEQPVDAGGPQGPCRVRSQLDERDRYRQFVHSQTTSGVQIITPNRPSRQRRGTRFTIRAFRRL